MRGISIGLSILLLGAGIGVPVILGALWPEYHWTANYLSELGAVGAPHGAIMTYAGFLPVAILWTLLTLLIGLRTSKTALTVAGVILLLGNSVSYFGAVMFRCDLGCPIEGSTSQMMHNLLGIIGYLTTPLALLLLGLHFLKANSKLLSMLTFLTAASCLIGFFGMASPELGDLTGVFQRMADFSMFVWMFAVALLLKQRVTA